jgi:Uma2 family endonuclease
LNGYVPDLVVLDRSQLATEPLWKSASTVTRGKSVCLAIEVVSANWQDDYAKKLEDYEALGIPEYWILDYRALGGKRCIGFPKRPTLSVYTSINGEYQLEQFRDGDRVRSRAFPELALMAADILSVDNNSPYAEDLETLTPDPSPSGRGEESPSGGCAPATLVYKPKYRLKEIRIPRNIR